MINLIHIVKIVMIVQTPIIIKILLLIILSILKVKIKIIPMLHLPPPNIINDLVVAIVQVMVVLFIVLV